MTKKYQKIYQYTVVFDPAIEGGYIADVPALPGCHTEGDTLKEARENVREAIECYLEGLSKEKKPIPTEPKEMVEKIRVSVGV